ncbi:MAG: hypothetical protein HF973_10850 [Chloroflexi bacterium]|nr:hypothetical protein [Chloroflexota bacterium]
MEQEKFILEQDQVELLTLQPTQEKLDWEALEKSADLYAEVYAEDSELRELTEMALAEWPE